MVAADEGKISEVGGRKSEVREAENVSYRKLCGGSTRRNEYEG